MSLDIYEITKSLTFELCGPEAVNQGVKLLWNQRNRNKQKLNENIPDTDSRYLQEKVFQDDGRAKFASGAPHDHQHSRQDGRDHEVRGGRDDDEARGGRQRDEISVGAQAPVRHHHLSDERTGNEMKSSIFKSLVPKPV